MIRLATRNVSAADTVRIGLLGLKTRRLRALLSALGVAIGVASLVAVLGLSDSSKADLVATLDRLGTNLLQIGPGQSLLGEQAVLPPTAARMIRRIPAVQDVAAIESVDA